MKRKLLSALVASTFLFGLSHASGSEKSIDESVKALIAMQLCQDNKQMDCIEKVTVTHSDGTSKDVKMQFGALNNSPTGGATRYENQSIELNYEYEKSGGPIKTTEIEAILKTQWIDLPTGGLQVPGFAVYFKNPSELFDTDVFTFVIRTSWLKPQNVALYAKNAIFKEEKIDGGKRFTFGGSKLTQIYFDDSSKYQLLYKPEGELLKADGIRESITLLLDHAAKYSKSAYPTECADFGYPVSSSNASSAGQPRLKSPNEIEYSIASPHFMPDGTVFRGYFQAELNTKYLECIWPNNQISKSTQFSISVVNEAGVRQVATTGVSFINNIISVRAFGFHYSAPTIKIEGNYGKAGFAGTKTPETSPSPSPKTETALMKKISITCVKGKMVRKMTALKPKCPAGYKKK